jgi:antitoxin FitA
MRVRCANWPIVPATGHIPPGTIRCMNSTQVVDVSGTQVNVVYMSKMIQVRNVPDEMHRALKTSAAAEGMSLSDYIKRELGGITAKASFEEIDARVRARGPSKVKRETIIRILRESRGD